MEFPTNGLQPKEEIEVAAFLKQYPQYDGRGIVVAIFDTGVDPNAEGLTTTIDGKRKMIDFVDTTGSGDVDCSHTLQVKDLEKSVEFENRFVVPLLSGRKALYGSQWKNPNGKILLGLKRLFELFPGQLLDRIKQERKKMFEKEQEALIAKLKNRVTELKSKDETKPLVHEAEAQLEQAQAFMKSYDDAGPIIDCIVFEDDQHILRTCIVVPKYGNGEETDWLINTQQWSQIIDLDSIPLMTDYSREFQFGTFSKQDLMHYTVNIYNEGTLLSIVTSAGSHGTHVASIVGAYYPDHPELNGAAPGVQMVSVKIGDSRLGSMETGTGLIRGLIAAKNSKCDLINMSYGETAKLCNFGRFKEVLEEIVHKHNIIYVGSAGNNGPALSSVGSPGGTSEAAIGVAAYVSQSMMEVQYSLRENVRDNLYTWSSRGPSTDGSRGVTLAACGGAIATVNQWTLARNKLMNGTSMSSPNCCGGLACLLSGLKQQSQTWNAYYIKNLIQNTARNVGRSPLEQGAGILSVLKAFELAQQYPYEANYNVRYSITIPTLSNARGVYLRDYEETNRCWEGAVSVNAEFHENTKNEEKVKYEKRFLLQCDADFVSVPKYLMMTSGSHSFSVKVDPTKLKSNQFYYTEIKAIDSENPEFGPVFYVPVTIIKPLKQDNGKYSGTIELNSGETSRHFLTPPAGARFFEIKLKGKEIDTQRIFALHIVQLAPHSAFDEGEVSKYITLAAEEESKNVFHIKGTQTIEVAIGQYWSSLGKSSVEFEIEYHGLQVPKEVTFIGGEVAAQIKVFNSLKTVEVVPKAKFGFVKTYLRPSENSIKLCSDARNTLPNGKATYELILNYDLKIEENSTEIQMKVPAISDVLYESELESQMLMLFNSHKQLLNVTDFKDKKIKLPKGEYTIKLQLRHESLDIIEKLKHHPVKVIRTLSKKIEVPIHSTLPGVVIDKNKFEKKKLKQGTRIKLFLKMVDDSSLPKDVKAGEVLCGVVKYLSQKDVNQSKLYYIIPEKKKEEKPEKLDKKLEKLDTRSVDEKMQEILVEGAISILKELAKKGKEFKETCVKFFEETKNKSEFNSKYVPLLEAYLQILYDDEESRLKEENYSSMVQLADSAVNLLPVEQLLTYYGSTSKTKEGKEPEGTEEEQLKRKKLNKEMDKQKDSLVTILHIKLQLLLSKAEEISKKEQVPQDLKDSILSTMKQLRQFIDTTGEKYVLTDCRYSFFKGNYGNCLAKASKAISDHAISAAVEKKLFELKLQCVEKLQWNIWTIYLKSWNVLKFPPKFAPL